MNRAFALTAGGILLFAFGTLLPVLYLDLKTQDSIHERLAQANERVFVTLIKGQIRKNLYGEAFYYSVEFFHDGKKFRIPVEVSSEFYHLQKEGKNLEAWMIMDRGRPYIRLPGGDPAAESPAIMLYIASALSMLGISFVAFGLVRGDK